MRTPLQTTIYIDGFNLYYGALKGTPYKWLNVADLCSRLLTNNTIVRIKYFTALVSARPGDLDLPSRQQLYLRALRTIANLEIIYGHFLTNTVTMRLANPLPNQSPFVDVIKTEEKGSDVNIATHLLCDGFRGEYQAAVLVTNDSDLVEPIRVVRHQLNLVVGVLNPQSRPSFEIARQVHFMKPIRRGALAASQFPDTLTDAQGIFTKPSQW
ncbi:MAG: hypothetical protein OHK0022_37940 [Roseiflexaceae bacterium]